MSAASPAKERIVHQLQEAIGRLHDDIDRVEFWAAALDHLGQSIPEYQSSDNLTRHLLPANGHGAPSDPAGRIRKH
jgi:hypothetical protein